MSVCILEWFLCCVVTVCIKLLSMFGRQCVYSIGLCVVCVINLSLCCEGSMCTFLHFFILNSQRPGIYRRLLYKNMYIVNGFKQRAKCQSNVIRISCTTLAIPYYQSCSPDRCLYADGLKKRGGRALIL
jgi:hypothetical protein